MPRSRLRRILKRPQSAHRAKLLGVIVELMNTQSSPREPIVPAARTLLKRALRTLLEFPSLHPARFMFFQWEASKERKRVAATAAQMNLPILEAGALRSLAKGKPDAKTAFILGTGASAARLSAEKLHVIQSQFSIGVNQWMFHSLIPDMYAYEFDERLALLRSLDRPEIRVAKPPILFLRPRDAEGIANAAHIPAFLRPTTYVYGRANLWTRKSENIVRDVQRALDYSNKTGAPALVVDDGASIVRMIALSYLLGFRRIVLVGVDLNSVEYFWDEDPTYIQRLGIDEFDAGQTGTVHETLSDGPRPFGVDVFISGMARALALVGVHLEVDSPLSALARSIPVAKW